jgi:tRNA-specific 2-thiouridylase
MSETVTVAFSGGKDSAAAVLLLRQQGYEVRTLTMRLGLAGEEEKLSRIENLARALGVPWEAMGLGRVFRAKVLDPFLNAYRAGRTPNPCVLCNRHVKKAPAAAFLPAATMPTRSALKSVGSCASRPTAASPRSIFWP